MGIPIRPLDTHIHVFTYDPCCMYTIESNIQRKCIIFFKKLAAMRFRIASKAGNTHRHKLKSQAMKNKPTEASRASPEEGQWAHA